MCVSYDFFLITPSSSGVTRLIVYKSRWVTPRNNKYRSRKHKEEGSLLLSYFSLLLPEERVHVLLSRHPQKVSAGGYTKKNPLPLSSQRDSHTSRCAIVVKFVLA